MRKLIIFALGGNEISPVLINPETGKMINPDLPKQWKQAWKTCEKLATFITLHQENQYLITHGNGPQIGNILIRSEYASKLIHKLPLDVCGADTQGALGYMLAQLSNSMRIRGLDMKTAEIVNQVVVDRDDPAFNNPTKFIGPPLTYDEAEELVRNQSYHCKYYKLNELGKEVWRRVVPSPNPKEIVEIDMIESCLLSGNIPIAVGGGGIPVIEVVPEHKEDREIYRCNYGISYEKKLETGSEPVSILCGVEGVIDKDLATSLLATRLIERARSKGMELEIDLVILTDVDCVKINYQQENQKDLLRLSLEEIRHLNTQGQFPSGSMGPKIEAVIRFLQSGGRRAFITNINLLDKTLKGRAGTVFS